jgi:hypothetical protein
VNLRRTLLPVFLLLAGIAASAQNITVHAVNGKTGQPLAEVRLLVFAFNGTSYAGSENSKSFDLHTDRNGVAAIRPDQIEGADHLQIWADFMTRCVNGINSTAISLKDILTSGLTDTNTCSKKIAAKPMPGTLTIYAREATLLEKMDW